MGIVLPSLGVLIVPPPLALLIVPPLLFGAMEVIDEATLAFLARLAAFAASVERSFEHSPAMLEVGSRFLLLAGGASVWPRFRHRFEFCHWPFFLSSAKNAVRDRDPKWHH